MSEHHVAIHCPVCGSADLAVPAVGGSAPPMLVVADGETRALRAISCRACTSVWFAWGEPRATPEGVSLARS